MRTCLLPVFAVGLLFGCAPTHHPTREAERPNIIYILADDLGYGELGVYGQEKIETPNLDALAQSGMRFTDHYAGSPVCAPSRYVLMTGRHTGNAYIRRNSELPDRGDVWNFRAMYENPELEGQRPIPAETVTLAKVLQEAGYRTAAIGKWGLGGPSTEGQPNRQGFDFFYGYLCQRQAHTYFPTHLWRNDERVLLGNELVDPHQSLPDGLDPYDLDSYALFQDQPDYSAERMHVETIRFIEDNRDNPFFLYLATPIPHVSLQAPRRWVNHYVEKFGDEAPYYSGDRYTPVRYPNATYAAMISYLDEQVGEIVEKLRDLGIYENTLILFSSDNGPVDGLGVDPVYFDSAAPFLGTRGWGKGTLHEGGIRVPMIAAWKNRIPAGSTTDHLSAFWDILPTLGEIAGVDPPDGMDGISFLSILVGDPEGQREHEYLYWEYPASGGQQAVRMGEWKAIRRNIISEGNLEIELYNLDRDIREQHNVADRYPEIVERIRRIMENARTRPEVGEFGMRALGD
jgi:arylsulfatase A-like enzyme